MCQKFKINKFSDKTKQKSAIKCKKRSTSFRHHPEWKRALRVQLRGRSKSNRSPLQKSLLLLGRRRYRNWKNLSVWPPFLPRLSNLLTMQKETILALRRSVREPSQLIDHWYNMWYFYLRPYSKHRRGRLGAVEAYLKVTFWGTAKDSDWTRWLLCYHSALYLKN